jgi:hypothetical protein
VIRSFRGIAANSYQDRRGGLRAGFRNLVRGLVLTFLLGLDAILAKNTLIDIASGSYSADTLFVETNIAVAFSISALVLVYFKPADIRRWRVPLWVLLILPAFIAAYIKLQTLGVLDFAHL